jgi:ATP-dependent RNA helicase DHX57
LVLLKDLISKRPDVKIILMSATLDAKSFSNYFHGAPVLMIPGFTHPVEDIYLEDFISQFLPDADVSDYGEDWEDHGHISKGLKNDKKAKRYEEFIDYKLIGDLVESICNDPDSKEGAILIFLPGTFLFIDYGHQ